MVHMSNVAATSHQDVAQQINIAQRWKNIRGQGKSHQQLAHSSSLNTNTRAQTALRLGHTHTPTHMQPPTVAFAYVQRLQAVAKQNKAAREAYFALPSTCCFC